MIAGGALPSSSLSAPVPLSQREGCGCNRSGRVQVDLMAIGQHHHRRHQESDQKLYGLVVGLSSVRLLHHVQQQSPYLLFRLLRDLLDVIFLSVCEYPFVQVHDQTSLEEYAVSTPSGRNSSTPS